MIVGVWVNGQIDPMFIIYRQNGSPEARLRDNHLREDRKGNRPLGLNTSVFLSHRHKSTAPALAAGALSGMGLDVSRVAELGQTTMNVKHATAAAYWVRPPQASHTLQPQRQCRRCLA